MSTTIIITINTKTTKSYQYLHKTSQQLSLWSMKTAQLVRKHTYIIIFTCVHYNLMLIITKAALAAQLFQPSPLLSPHQHPYPHTSVQYTLFPQFQSDPVVRYYLPDLLSHLNLTLCLWFLLSLFARRADLVLYGRIFHGYSCGA